MIFPEWSPITLGLAAEIGGLCLSGFVFFYSRRYTFAEAAAYGIITVLMLISIFMQIAELFLIPELVVFGEGILLCAAVSILMMQQSRWGECRKTLKYFVTTYPLGSFGLGFGWLFLFIGVVLAPGADSLFSSLSFPFPMPGFPGEIQMVSEVAPTFGLHSSILFFLCERWHSSMVSRIFGLLMYLSIAFSTYSLARRYSWPSTALTVTLVVVGMPKLVFQSFSPADSLLSAAAGLFCLLAVHRLIEQPNTGDFGLLLPGISFGVAEDPVGWVFPMILVLLAGVLLTRRHGARYWRGFIFVQPVGLVLAVLSALIFSGFLPDMMQISPEPGERSAYPANEDGLTGAASNLIRYLVESAEPIPPLDRVWNWIGGVRLSDQLQSGYDRFFMPLVGNRGAAERFALGRYQNTDVAWFGPLAFLLILPAVGYALFRGHRRTKAVAVALMGYLYVITLMLAWKAGNGKYLTPFFTCGGFLVASLLPPWRVSSSTKRLLQVVGLLLLFYSLSHHPNLSTLISNP